MKTRDPITHELKCWTEPFNAILDGRKRFEARRDDRDYQVGDLLHLREWTPDGYTGYEVTCIVRWILRCEEGITPGWGFSLENVAIMSIDVIGYVLAGSAKSVRE